MPKLTIDGVEVEVAAGTNVLEAARQAGIDVPHYCYHPGLAIAGQCRLCMVDIDKVPRPQISCNMTVADGMVVRTQTERVVETRRSIMEFHLINHPLDCPVCDQAGECWLQIYYMKHGLYDPRMADEKVHKPKAIPLGRHVILDAERCILCSRCVRFCDEITGTGELGIFNRGDHSEIGLFPGKSLDNKYSGNVIDICPVGALTDRDFRFAVRVWYLDTAKSICNGCARGCNVDVHTSRRRPHHNHGRRVARLKPRYNADVNRWWMCDEGRYGFDGVDDDSRLTAPARREGNRLVETTWEDALSSLAAALRRYRPDEIAVLASPQMSNEDLHALARLCGHLGIASLDYRVPPREAGDQDELLIRADKNPNTRGAELLGVTPGKGGLDAEAMLRAAAAKQVKLLWILHHDLLRSAWPGADVQAAIGGAEILVFQGMNANDVSAGAHLVLPSAAHVERDGTFTNFEGRVQRFRMALEPLGDARPDWQIFGDLAQGLGLADPAFAERADQVFAALAAAVPRYAGMSYRSLGDAGRVVGA